MKLLPRSLCPRIEVWSSAEAIGRCYKGLGKSPTSFSVLWNAMVHPLTRHSIYGMLWYQGTIVCSYGKMTVCGLATSCIIALQYKIILHLCQVFELGTFFFSTILA